MQVWKYPLKPGQNSIEMPAGAKILWTGIQNDNPQIWALVTPGNPPSVREIAVVGTGHELPERAAGWLHVGTFLLYGGMLVCHVFEITS